MLMAAMCGYTDNPSCLLWSVHTASNRSSVCNSGRRSHKIRLDFYTHYIDAQVIILVLSYNFVRTSERERFAMEVRVSVRPISIAHGVYALVTFCHSDVTRLMDSVMQASLPTFPPLSLPKVKTTSTAAASRQPVGSWCGLACTGSSWTISHPPTRFVFIYPHLVVVVVFCFQILFHLN